MINRIKSAKFHLTRFLFAVPLLAFILLAFRTEWDRQGQLNPRVASPHKTVDSVPGARPLVIVNGEKKSVDYNISRIPVEQIESMNVFKGRSAEKKYGVEGRNGVIAITLKKGFEAERIKEFERREHPEIERPNDVERIKEFERSEHPETERPNNVERIKELKMAQEQIQRQAAELEEQLRNLREKRVDMQKEVVEQWDGDQVRIRKEQFEQLEHMKQALHDQSQQQEAMEQQEMINGQGKQLSDLDMKMNTLDQQQVKLRSKLQADMNRLVSDYQKKMEKLNRRKEKLNK